MWDKDAFSNDDCIGDVQFVGVYFSVLQHVAVQYSVFQHLTNSMPRVGVATVMQQCVAACCSVLQRVVASHNPWHIQVLRRLRYKSWNRGLNVRCCLMRSQKHTLQHAATRCNMPQHTATYFTYKSGLESGLLPDENCRTDTATHCNTLQCAATCCNTLQHDTTRCNTMQVTATQCSLLQHITNWGFNSRCCPIRFLLCTLQHTATHCNTLQQTSSHCNKLQMNTWSRTAAQRGFFWNGCISFEM